MALAAIRGRGRARRPGGTCDSTLEPYSADQHERTLVERSLPRRRLRTSCQKCCTENLRWGLRVSLAAPHQRLSRVYPPMPFAGTCETEAI
jgi:hypothetical protein